MHRWAWVGFLVTGCHVVVSHSPGEVGVSDAPGAGRALRDGSRELAPDARREAGVVDRRAEARPDLARDLRVPDGVRPEGGLADTRPPDKGLPDAAGPDAPPPPLGYPCGDGTLGSVGCCSKQSWCWVSPLPQGNDLTSAWAFSKGEVYFAGAHGTVLRWDGKTFTREAIDSPSALEGIWGDAASKKLWAVGPGGVLHRTANGWAVQAVSGAPSPYLRAIWGKSANEIYAVGNNLVAVYNGTSWQKLGTSPSAALRAVWGGPTSLYVAGNDGIWSAPYGSSVWTLLLAHPGGEVRGLWGNPSGSQIVAAGTSNLLARSTGGGPFVSANPSGGSTVINGKVWGPDTTGAFWIASAQGLRRLASTNAVTDIGLEDPTGIHGVEGSPIAVGRRGAIWTYNGSSFIPQHLAATGTHLTGVSGSSVSTYAAAGGGELIKLTGLTWTVEAKPSGHSYRGISNHGSYFIAVGALGALGGAAAEKSGAGVWTLLGAPPVPLAGVWASGTQSAEAVSGDKVYGYTVAASWKESATLAALNGIWGTTTAGNSERYAVGAGIFGNDGNGWLPLYAPAGVTFHAIWGRAGAAPRDLVAVGAGSVVATRIGGIWSKATLVGKALVNLRAVSAGPATGSVLVVGDGGTIASSLDLATWSDEASGTDKTLYGVWTPLVSAAGSCNAYAVGETGTILCKKAP